MVEENKDKVVNKEDKIGNKDKKMNNAMREDCQMLQRERGEGGVEMGEKKGISGEGLEESTRQDLLSDSATSTCQCFICPRPASVKCPGCDLVACSLQHLALHRLIKHHHHRFHHCHHLSPSSAFHLYLFTFS